MHGNTKIKFVKVTVKVVPAQAINAYRGSRSIAPHILNLSTRWQSVVSLRPRPLYPQEKHLWYPLKGKHGGLQSWSGCLREEKNPLPLLAVKLWIVLPKV